MRKIPEFALLAALAIFSLYSCASVKQGLKMEPIPASLPTSASPLLAIDGKVLSAADYQGGQSFSFTKTVKNPIRNKSDLVIKLGDDLERVKREKGGNAIVNLRFQVMDVDTGAVGWIAVERSLGVDALLLGLTVVGYSGDFNKYDAQSQSSLKSFLLVTGGGGAALLAGSFLHEAVGTVNYTYQVDGEVVTLK
jgi:hypothetical protein